MKLPFYIFDVFAEEKLQGNQLAVFRDLGIDSDLMQRIAREMNFSETTFITSIDEENHCYGVRIFTPESELPFAGHPTLGTAYVIQQSIINERIDRLTLKMEAGKIPVTFTYKEGEPDVIWMKQLNPVFGDCHPKQKFADFLNIRPEDIEENYPIQEVSTGIYFFIIPLKSREALQRIEINWDKLKKYSKNTEAKWPHIFCSEPEDPMNQLKARMITTFTEDPATGSANGCLAGYLIKHRFFNSTSINVRVEQGVEVGRASLLYLKAEETHFGIDIHVGGKCAMIAHGEFV